MKIFLNKSILLIGASILSLVALNSCVKNRNLTATDFTQIQPIVELITSPGNTSPDVYRVVSYAANVTSAINTVYVNYAGPGPAPRDITVTLAISPTTVVAKNNDTTIMPRTHYVMVGPAVYSFPSQVVIKQGTYFTPVNFTIKPNLIDLTIENAFALEIVDAQGVIISKNYHTQLYGLVVSNPYAGDYNATGWFFHPSVGRAINAVYNISTISGTRSESPLADLGGSNFKFDFDVVNNVATNWSSVGATPGPQTPTPGSSGFMTADNPGGVDYSDPSNAGNIPGVGEWTSARYNNTYDPATKTFWFHYGYRAGVIGSQAVYTRQTYEKMVKL